MKLLKINVLKKYQMKLLFLNFPLFLFFILITEGVFAQDDMMSLFNNTKPVTEYTSATFKSTHIVLGQSIETPAPGNMIFVIQHHFGYVNQGIYEFFGLDQASLRLGFEFGLTPWLSVGFGRATHEKTYDVSTKIKILRQSKGGNNMPFTLTYYGDIGINTLKVNDKTINYFLTNRLTFVNQLLIARKFSRTVSLQLSPTLIHRNLVLTPQEQNNVWSVGAGGRFKLSNHTSLNLEYYYLLPGQTETDFNNTFSIGFDIETGGHVFQLFLSNSQGILEQHFITKTSGNWLKGDVLIGFNITRTFVIRKPKNFK